MQMEAELAKTIPTIFKKTEGTAEDYDMFGDDEGLALRSIPEGKQVNDRWASWGKGGRGDGEKAQGS
jgi:hypothetical protein